MIDATLKSPIPVVWNEQPFTQQRGFWEEARAHGVRDGWTIAVHGRHGELGVISLARSKKNSPPTNSRNRSQTGLASHAANGVVENFIAQKNAPAVMPVLTQREREVLRWTAFGKTSDEIGLILGISSRTVNFHITTGPGKARSGEQVTCAVAKPVTWTCSTKDETAVLRARDRPPIHFALDDRHRAHHAALFLLQRLARRLADLLLPALSARSRIICRARRRPEYARRRRP